MVEPGLGKSILTWGFVLERVDENRTRTITLGTLWRCMATICGLADLRGY